ncbi:MAG: thioredoxin [Selenomonadales bacterium]|jgi:thioredoxin 1|nr:thioredoxin [Selenomonadales bacterium]
MSAIDINKGNFQAEVMESDKLVLLDFWAPWCGPCRRVVPIVEEIAEENPDIKVGKVNVDEEVELAEKFGVMSIPMLVVLKNGEVVNQAVGMRPKHQILEMVDEA